VGKCENKLRCRKIECVGLKVEARTGKAGGPKRAGAVTLPPVRERDSAVCTPCSTEGGEPHAQKYGEKPKMKMKKNRRKILSLSFAKERGVRIPWKKGEKLYRPKFWGSNEGEAYSRGSRQVKPVDQRAETHLDEDKGGIIAGKLESKILGLPYCKGGQDLFGGRLKNNQRQLNEKQNRREGKNAREVCPQSTGKVSFSNV